MITWLLPILILALPLVPGFAQNACQRPEVASFDGANASQVFINCMMCFDHADCTKRVTVWCLGKQCKASLGCDKFNYQDSNNGKTIGCKINAQIEKGKPTPQPTPKPKAVNDTKVTSTTPKTTPSAKTPSSPSESKNSSVEKRDIGAVSPSGNANSDLTTCSNLRRKAVQCCNDPQSCVSTPAPTPPPSASSNPEGLREYCRQMQSSGESGGDHNSRLANACYEAYMACQTSCEEMGRAHGDSAFSSIAQQCGLLSGRMALIGQQGFNMYQASSGGDVCSQLAQSNPQSAGGMPGDMGGAGSGNANDPNNPYNQQQANNPNDPYGCQSNPNSPACIQCTNDPSLPMCRGLMDNRMAEGQGGFGGPESARSPSDFNVGNLGDAGGLNDGFTGGGLQASAGAAMPTKTVPNNSGGSLPGEGGSGNPARLDTPSRGGGGAGKPTVNTDIEQGFRGGGGGYAYPSGANGGYAANGDSYYGGRGGTRGPANDDGGMTGLDLRKYLPGGSLAAGRRLGGFQPSSEINGPSVDMFERISRRMQEKCRLGILLGCG